MTGEINLHNPLSTFGSENVALFNLKERNRIAQGIIRDYAVGHAKADVGIGILGTVIPGAGMAALLASIAVQGPLVYQPMAKRLAAVYSVSPDEVTEQLVSNAVFVGGIADVASELASEFMMEIASELLQEAGLGAAISWIPIFGGVVAAGLDVVIAATLTWRVGTMISIYHQNGGRWVEDRHATYELAHKLVGSLSPATSNRVRLDNISSKIPEVQDRQVSYILRSRWRTRFSAIWLGKEIVIC
jgi:hypothetical protein